MAITIGSQLGSHEVTALLGKGGMGEVYRARDSKLKREVAIKILTEEFSTDSDRTNRFQREAEVLASLNHPNIASIYDIQESNGLRYLVLELVEGDTLQDRIQRGPVPIPEALRIATQVCEALEAAHERGIVHRDLKPANIKLTHDGKVKVLDFGLAKAFEQQFHATVSNSPTLMSASIPGVILGTAAYMSPEQARGKIVDRRADVWAFGCVLYEMLTAKQVFTGESVTDILARILEREPNFELLNSTPSRIRDLVRRCLDKDVRRRFQDIGDVRFEIEAALSGRVAEVEVPRQRHSLVTFAVGLAALLLAIPAALYFRGTRTDSPEIRLDITTPPTTDLLSLAVSPDGRKVLFVATADNKARLWLRTLDSTSLQPIGGTEGATYPFWAPDGRNVGFFAEGKLKRVDVYGGAPQILATAPAGRGGAWNKDDVILFAPGGADRIYRISAAGGEVTPVTQMEGTKQNNHRMPQFLPDGHHFLFYAQGANGRGEYLASFDSKEQLRLFDADAAATFIPPGYVIFLRQGTLFAQAFDTAKNVPTGGAFSVTQQVAFDSLVNIAAVSAAPGVLAYRTGSALSTGLAWFDRRGQSLGAVGEADFNGLNPELSTDGKRVVLDRGINGTGIWVMDASRGVGNRLTVDASTNIVPIWSPRGDRIAFGSDRSGIQNIYVKSAGGGPDELLLESSFIKWPESWSPDGHYILYREQNPKGFDLLALSPEDHKIIPIANTPFEEREGQFSPDGKWVAYQSNESGRPEIYIQQFPNPTGKSRVSTAGGAQPRWRSDGKELFYISPDAKLMAAPIAIASNGQSIEVGNVATLFPVRLALGPTPALQRQQYAVSPDGQRFLMNITMQDQIANPITMILNWHPQVK